MLPIKPLVAFATVLAAVLSSSATASPVVRRGGGFDQSSGVTWSQAVSKAKTLVKKLTLEEMVTLATGVGWEQSPCIGNIAAISSINFPGYCLQDSPTGVRDVYNVSAFSASINVAATFDKDLMYTHGVKMAEEERAKGVSVTLGPVMNMARAPEGGRMWEAAGADPFLTSFTASLQVQGIQSQGVIATAKHYILNDQEHNRNGGDSLADERTFREVYLRPFKACVDAGVGAVMCSYNSVNGTYACENPQTLGILKNDLGFQGFVMTDWWAAISAAPTANAGTDMMMPGGRAYGDLVSYWGPNLVAEVNAGNVSESRITDMATRILASWIKMGQDDGKFPAVNFDTWNSSASQPVNVQSNHKDHIREVGAASSILVKNDGSALPLSGVKKIAVIGEDAAAPASLNGCSDHGCIDGTVAQGWGSGTTYFPYIVAPVDGVTARAKKSGISVTSALNNTDLTSAVSAAKAADVAVVFVFADSGEGYITVEGNVGDRNDLELWHSGAALIEAVAAVKETIVVIHSPGPVNMTGWSTLPNVKSIIYALMPGQETGNSIADVLFGDVNPSGRLPFTVAANRADYGADVVYSTDPVTYSEGILIDYRWFEATGKKPVYAFGHGLSYTSFAYSNFQVKKTGSNTYSVSFNVKNTGKLYGHEVVQLYVKLPSSTCQSQGCSKELRNFERIPLYASQTQTVSFTLTADDLSYYSVAASKWVVPKGTFEISVGASSADIRASTTITI